MKFKIILWIAPIFITINCFSQNFSDSLKTTFLDKNQVFYKDSSKYIYSEGFNQGICLTPLELIQGKIPGLNITQNSGAPGSGFTIIDNGVYSFSSNNNLIYIVDNLPVSSNFMHLNPSDIENVIFIDDPAISRKYSNQSSNGVLLFTTKKGNRKFKVNYKNNFSLSYLPNTIDVFSANEFKALINERFADDPDALSLLLNYNTNWQEKIYKTAYGQDHHLNVSGLLKNLPFSISGGKTDMDGILRSSNFNRTTTNIWLEPSLLKNHLTLSLNFRGEFKNNRIANEDAIYNAVHYNPTRPVYAFGEYSKYYDNDFALFNPVALLDYTNHKSESDAWSKNIKLDYKFHFLPDLRIILNYGRVNFENKNSIQKDSSIIYNHSPLTEITTITNDYSLHSLMSNYSRNIGALNSYLDFSIGYSLHNYDSKTKYSSLFIDEIYYNETSRSSTNRTMASYFTQFSFLVLSRYNINFMYSCDGDSRYSEENKWYNGYALSFNWNIIKEPFLQNVDIISDLGIKLSFNKVPNNEINFTDSYMSVPLYTVGEQNNSYSFGDNSFYTIRTTDYDPNIKPETITTYNLGLNFGILNRIRGNLNLYNRTTKDVLLEVYIPIGSNFTDKLTTNAGTIENKGIEFDLSTLLINQPNLSWNFATHFSYNKNEIVKMDLYNDPDYIGMNVGSIGSGNTIQVLSPEHSAYSFYVYEQIYDVSGKPVEGVYVDRNEDGVITNEDRYHYGSINPDILIGLSSILKYKNWEFSFSGRASLGNYAYNNINSWSSYNQLYNNGYLKNISTSINETNFETSQLFSDYYVENASFFKMDQITLGYHFKKLFNDKLKIKTYFTVQNAFTITKYSGLDPEVPNGIDNYHYPRSRTFSLGLNIEF